MTEAATYRLTPNGLERVRPGERAVDLTGDLRAFLKAHGLPTAPFCAVTFDAESDPIAFIRVAIDSAPRAAREKREDLARAFAAALDAAGVKADTLAAYLGGGSVQLSEGARTTITFLRGRPAAAEPAESAAVVQERRQKLAAVLTTALDKAAARSGWDAALRLAGLPLRTQK